MFKAKSKQCSKMVVNVAECRRISSRRYRLRYKTISKYNVFAYVVAFLLFFTLFQLIFPQMWKTSTELVKKSLWFENNVIKGFLAIGSDMEFINTNHQYRYKTYQEVYDFWLDLRKQDDYALKYNVLNRDVEYCLDLSKMWENFL